MRYWVTLEPTSPPIEVDVKELPDGTLAVTAAGKPIDVDVSTAAGVLSVRVDGRIVDLTTEGSPPDFGVIASGHRSYVRALSDRQRAADSATQGSAAAEDWVRSPMPGRVVRVLVKAGDEISVGQPLVVIEAMKMENELRAKRAGRVSDVLVIAGAAVEASAKLVRVA